MFFLTFFLIILLFVAIPLFSIFIQTIKNLILFVFLVIVISLNLMISFGLEFFPIFFVLIYVGAIVVTTLFMVLTFDLRSEYVKKIFSRKALFNSFLYFCLTPIFFSLATILPNFLLQNGELDKLDRTYLFHRCHVTQNVDPIFCNKHFGSLAGDKSLYGAVSEHISDIAILSNNLYSHYSLLFIILGVILTLTLFAALTLVKFDINKKNNFFLNEFS